MTQHKRRSLIRFPALLGVHSNLGVRKGRIILPPSLFGSSTYPAFALKSDGKTLELEPCHEDNIGQVRIVRLENGHFQVTFSDNEPECYPVDRVFAAVGKDDFGMTRCYGELRVYLRTIRILPPARFTTTGEPITRPTV